MDDTEPAQALNLDLAQQQSFVRYFKSLPETPPSTIRFFNRSDYYTCHGSDAKFTADNQCKLLKYMGEEPKLSYVCLSKNVFDAFVRELLLVKQYRVEVYVKSSQSKNNDWLLQYKGSPGNLTQFEELLYENSNIAFTNSVMGIKFGANKVTAVACVNVTEVKIEVCEVNDNECFTELEAILAQVGPKECVIPNGDSAELVALKNVLERNGILVAKVKKSDFSSDDILQDLNRILFFHDGQQRSADTIAETALKEAMGSLQALIRFLNLTGDERNFNQYRISKLDAHRFVRLDNAALYALNILSQGGSNITESSLLLPTTSKSYSLLGILNSCVTLQGQRLLEQWIKQPLKDYNLINERLDIVECLVKDPETRDGLCKDILTRMPDLVILSKKLYTKKATPEDLYKMYLAVNVIPSLLRVLRKPGNSCIQAALIDPIGEIASDMEKFQEMIEQTIDMDSVERGEFFIKSSYDEDLTELENKKLALEEKMQKLQKRAADDLGFDDTKSIKLDYSEQFGYFFRVTLRDERALRNNKKYKIIDAIKGGVRFTNDKLSEINEEYTSVKSEYEDKQKHVIKEIIEIAQGYADSLRNLNMLLATVDVLTSFANVAVNSKTPYVRPKMHPADHGVLNLKRVRHPCLEQQDDINYIPNSVSFDQKDKSLYIITGPNMCGKSTYIRSVGVCVLMAHIGCWVPCEEAEISIVDAILARVGADDCQLKGLSTFMLEMIETSSIIKVGTKNSLVIIDELGRGTSTYDGCGIAWAIVEYLAKESKSFTLFATHFHELTRLATTCETIGNLHVTAITSNNTITPLYQVRDGECDKSYGVHCARLAEFPEDVIQWAVDQQKQLEHQQGMKFITNYEPSLKRQITDEGDELIKSTLEYLKGLDLEKMSDEELKKILKDNKDKLEASENLFIKGLLSEDMYF